MQSATLIEPAELNAAIGRSAPVLVVDVRTPAEFESEHIAGAVSMPLADLGDSAAQLKPDQDIVLVCRTDRRARTAAKLLEANGLVPRVLLGGIVAWSANNFPLVEGKKSLPIDRQVQLIAGSIVLTGTLLGAFVSTYWLVLPAFVGAGLTYAGLSGNCGLAMLLAQAPWNRNSKNSPSCSAPRS